MKFRCAVLSAALLCALFGGWTISAAGPDDIYLQAYNLIQEGDEYATAGRADLSRERYEEARKDLMKLQKSYPTYNSKAVEIRMEYLNEKLGKPAGATNAPPATVPAPSTNQPAVPRATPVQPAAPPVEPTPKPAPAAPRADESGILKNRVSQLESDNAMLQAKLQEAL